MSIWLIDPHDPLIFRDGRPFDPTPGARAVSLPFPLPSVTAGAVRTRMFSHPDGGFYGDPTKARKIAVAGPLLVALGEQASVDEWFIPAPADALLLRAKPGDAPNSARLVQLCPLQREADELSDLPADLFPIGQIAYDPAKPHPEAPRFWRWDAFAQWLKQGAVHSAPQSVALASLGIQGPLGETRMHVQIEAERQSAADGALFQTRGLAFVAPDTDGSLRRLALAVATDGQLREGYAPLGGERRLVCWRTGPQHSLQAALPCPDEVRQQIISSRACRLVLLTPAYFAAGFRPAYLRQTVHGVTPDLVGIAVGRAQVCSGWDLARKQPKASRRLVPAGTTLFLRLDCAEQADLNAWIDAHWMGHVSDDETGSFADSADWFRTAGFGLAALGAWDNRLHPMQTRSDDNAPTA
jgi:CRISPR-associated protein Cmr3